MNAPETNIIRLRITVSGVVQGVGFRPFVHNLASRQLLSGYVRNDNGSVEIEVQGPSDSVSSFLKKLENNTPALAVIDRIQTGTVDTVCGDSTFNIRKSISSTFHPRRFIPADTATCDECLRELFNRSDRRFRYPFVNCTNCGPRFTIISSLPYDRQHTTMAAFKMCKDCQDEYDDPTNRRFHAQPNACSKCGPSLSFIEAKSRVPTCHADDALRFAVKELSHSRIIAIKGLGGFHLICDALDKIALQKLRQRKQRARKPFALMMTDPDMVRQNCQCSEEEMKELTSPTRPIVLLKRLDACSLPEEIAPGIDRLGVMLPYTPLHYLLLQDYGKPLVATSANLREEPIAIESEEAQARLAHIADGFLVHDRVIYSRYDDSVIRFTRAGKLNLRRARGMAPLPIKLPFTTRVNVLACGAHLKNTFCLIHKDQAFVSQHIGDLENVETIEHFEDTLNTYMKLFDFTPELIAHDCHPDYLSTAFALNLADRLNLRSSAVQHHHAHVVSCMVEHALTEEVIGVAFDGLGYGTDGTLWGGEFLLSSLKDYRRLAHFEPVALPGGSQAIKEPWRMAVSYALSAQQSGPGVFNGFIEDLKGRYGHQAIHLVQKQIEKRLNAPFTSSCGRLFDAMSALLGVCYKADYEGQAAMELEAFARQCKEYEQRDQPQVYPYEIVDDEAPFVIKVRPILEAAYDDFLNGTAASIIALRFHYTIAHLMLAVVTRIRSFTGIDTVCLGGGVFQNELLLTFAHELLMPEGFKVFFPRKLPVNDGGISLGQAVVALAQSDGIVCHER